MGLVRYPGSIPLFNGDITQLEKRHDRDASKALLQLLSQR
jgi:hypothetical protein